MESSSKLKKDNDLKRCMTFGAILALFTPAWISIGHGFSVGPSIIFVVFYLDEVEVGWGRFFIIALIHYTIVWVIITIIWFILIKIIKLIES